jgi:hypothetical protein
MMATGVERGRCYDVMIQTLTSCDISVLNSEHVCGKCPFGISLAGSRLSEGLKKALPVRFHQPCGGDDGSKKIELFSGPSTLVHVLSFPLFLPPSQSDWQVKGEPPAGSRICRLTVRASLAGHIEGYRGCERCCSA